MPVNTRILASLRTKKTSGSPNEVIGRTHRAVFRLRKPIKRPKRQRRKASKQFRNPIQLAREWQNALDSGQVASKAALASRLGISRARVTQVLRLLRLAPVAEAMILSLGDPMREPIVTERTLRGIVSLPSVQHEARVAKALAGDPRLAQHKGNSHPRTH